MSEDSIAREELDDVGYQTREVYAQYGLTSYMSQVMERGLVNVLTVRATAESEKPTQSTFDRHFSNLSRLTMGQLVGRFTASTLSEPGMDQELQEAAKVRNLIAHRFFWDRAAHFMSFAGREAMLTELAEALVRFEQMEEHLSQLVRTVMRDIGFEPQWVEERVAEEMADLRASAPFG